MPDSFWCEWQDLVGEGCCSQRFISDKYMGLIRNVYRFGWLVPYLFGASPAICDSFLRGRKSSLPFQKTGKGHLYRPMQPPCACPISVTPTAPRRGSRSVATACLPM